MPRPALSSLLLAAVSLAPPTFSAQTQDLATAKSLMQQGLTAARQGDLPRARAAFTHVVKLAPQVAAGHAALGSVLLSLHEFEASARELTTAHRIAANDLAVDLNLARAQAGLGNNDQAVALFRECLSAPTPPSLSPEETVAFATALASTGEASAANELLAHAVDAAPDSARLNDALGTLLAGMGQMERAIPLFQRAVTIDPAFGQAQYHLSVALLALGQTQQSLAPAELAVDATPASFERQLQLGRVLSAMHRDNEALEHLHRAAGLAQAKPSPDALYALALALQASGDASGSLRFFAAVTSVGPADRGFDRTAALTNQALAHVQTGDAEGALPLYAQALALGPDSATLRENFGAAYLQKANLTHALEQFQAGLSLEPENAQLHYDLGLAYKLKDDLASAVPEFERAATLDPALPDPAYTLGVIYMQQGRFADAASNLKRAVSLQPNNGDAWALLGSVLKDSGQPADATAALQQAILLEPDQPSLHIQLAALESQAGQREQAAAERKIAAELSRAANNRQRASFALKSGRALLNENKLAEAAVQLANASEADPTLAEPHQLLAVVYARQGKAAEAALEHKQAAALTASTPHPGER